MSSMQWITFDDDGNCIGSNFMDYLIPTAWETPRFELLETCTPSPHHPIGAKGVGESATVGSPAAYVNAVIDALAHLGVRNIDMPLLPDRVWSAIQVAQTSSRVRARWTASVLAEAAALVQARAAVRARDRGVATGAELGPRRLEGDRVARRPRPRLARRRVRGADGRPRSARTRSPTAGPGCCSSGRPTSCGVDDRDGTVDGADGVRERRRVGGVRGTVPAAVRSSSSSAARRRCTRSRVQARALDWDVAVIDDGGRRRRPSVPGARAHHARPRRVSASARRPRSSSRRRATTTISRCGPRSRPTRATSASSPPRSARLAPAAPPRRRDRRRAARAHARAGRARPRCGRRTPRSRSRCSPTSSPAARRGAAWRQRHAALARGPRPRLRHDRVRRRREAPRSSTTTSTTGSVRPAACTRSRQIRVSSQRLRRSCRSPSRRRAACRRRSRRPARGCRARCGTSTPIRCNPSRPA